MSITGVRYEGPAMRNEEEMYLRRWQPFWVYFIATYYTDFFISYEVNLDTFITLNINKIYKDYKDFGVITHRMIQCIFK